MYFFCLAIEDLFVEDDFDEQDDWLISHIYLVSRYFILTTLIDRIYDTVKRHITCDIVEIKSVIKSVIVAIKYIIKGVIVMIKLS